MSFNNLLKTATNFYNKVSLASREKLSQIGSIKTFSGRAKFCGENFTRITSGSSRVIYEYDADHVIKLAKNIKGIAQNRTESDGFIQQHYGNIVAKVIDSDPDDAWILVERASKVSPAKFKSITGFTIQELENYLRSRFSVAASWAINIPPELEAKMDESELIQELVDLMANFNMPVGDFGRINSWGVIKDRLVVVDYGLTKETYDEFYRK